MSNTAAGANTAREAYYSEQARNDAYSLILGSLGRLQRKVFDCILINQPISNNGISEKTGVKVHIVSARVNELRGYEKNTVTGIREINPEKQHVEFAGYDYSSKPKVCLWKICNKQLPINFK